MKRGIDTKYKGGILIYALFVVVLLSLTTLFITLIFSLQLKPEVKLTNHIRKENRAASILTLTTVMPFTSLSDNQSLDMEENTVNITEQFWGIFTLRSVSVISLNDTGMAMAILGSQASKNPALYLPQSIYSVDFSNDVFIKGTCFLPMSRGINIANKIQGKILPSENTLPPLSDKLQQYLIGLFERTPNPHNSDYLSEISNKTILTHSFAKNTRVILCNTPFIRHKINGNVILFSHDTVIITRQAQLNNVLVVAPKIIVESNVTGRMQLIASKEIIVKRHVALLAPSSVVVISKNEKASVTIHENCLIEGGVMLQLTRPAKQKHYRLHIKKSKCYGVVYTNNYFKPDSVEIQGSCYVQGFFYKDNSSLSINKVAHLSITTNDTLTSVAPLFNTKPQKIAKWVY